MIPSSSTQFEIIKCCTDRIISDMLVEYEADNIDSYIGNILSVKYNIANIVSIKIVAIVRILAYMNYWSLFWDIEVHLIEDISLNLYRHHICPKNKRWMRYIKLIETCASFYRHIDAYRKSELITFFNMPLVHICLFPHITSLWCTSHIETKITEDITPPYDEDIELPLNEDDPPFASP